jgi:D-alanine-D-alanine ligase
MSATRVAVIGGGANCEHDVSLASAAAVIAALTTAGYAVVPLTIGRDGTWRYAGRTPIGLARSVEVLQSCAAAVPVLHGPHGEDGTLAALLDLAGVPCVGSPLSAGALAMDKWATKLVAEAVGIRTAPGRVVTARTRAAIEAEPFAGPVVVKPVAAGSSHGVSRVSSDRALRIALDAAFSLDSRVLVEDFVLGREIDLAVLGRADGTRYVAPALQIVKNERDIFDLASKYDGSARFLVPAPLEDAQRKELEGAAVAIYDALGCACVARIDFFWTQDGPVLNEVNTMPGFTEHSQVPRMFAAAGTSYPDLLDLLVRDTLERHR